MFNFLYFIVTSHSPNCRMFDLLFLIQYSCPSFFPRSCCIVALGNRILDMFRCLYRCLDVRMLDMSLSYHCYLYLFIILNTLLEGYVKQNFPRSDRLLPRQTAWLCQVCEKRLYLPKLYSLQMVPFGYVKSDTCCKMVWYQIVDVGPHTYQCCIM